MTPSPALRIVSRTLVLALGLAVPVALGAQSGLGSDLLLSGRVTIAGTDDPVPMTLLSVPGADVEAFTAADGTFRLRVPGDARWLMVEQLGFEPSRVDLVGADGATKLEVELVPRTMDLDGLRIEVEAPRCESSGPAGHPAGQARAGEADPARAAGGTAVVMREARRNAERYRALLDRYPVVVRYERVRRYIREDGSVAGERVDTTVHDSEAPRWAYTAGGVLERDGERATFHVPSLYDLAREAFQEHHCFRYAGVVPTGSERVVRVAFEPSAAVSGADVAGSLFLHPETALLRTAEFRVTRLPDDLHVKELRVDVGYTEIRPFLLVPEVIRTVQRLEDVSFRGDDVTTYEAEERLLDVDFRGNDPATPGDRPGSSPHPTRR